MAKNILENAKKVVCIACKTTHAIPRSEKPISFDCEFCGNSLYVEGDKVSVLGVAKNPEKTSEENDSPGGEVVEQEDDGSGGESEETESTEEDEDEDEKTFWEEI